MTLMPGPLIGLSLTLALAAATACSIPAPARAEKRHIVVTAIEPKGGATVATEPFPVAGLPEGKGYVLKEPDQSGRWEVAVYVFDPRQILVDEGDEVTLEFVGINGASHPTTITGYDRTFELKRGEVRRVTFTAGKTGVFPIVCAAHHPTMVAELIVAPRK
jgi:hypothetical protein